MTHLLRYPAKSSLFRCFPRIWRSRNACVCVCVYGCCMLPSLSSLLYYEFVWVWFLTQGYYCICFSLWVSFSPSLFLFQTNEIISMFVQYACILFSVLSWLNCDSKLTSTHSDRVSRPTNAPKSTTVRNKKEKRMCDKSFQTFLLLVWT